MLSRAVPIYVPPLGEFLLATPDLPAVVAHGMFCCRSALGPAHP